MIVFYNKKNGEIIGTIDGRVHYDEHLKTSMCTSDVKASDVARLIIGFEDNGKTEQYLDVDGKKQKRPVYKKHNLHLWQHQLDFENPKNPKGSHNHKVDLKTKLLVANS